MFMKNMVKIAWYFRAPELFVVMTYRVKNSRVDIKTLDGKSFAHLMRAQRSKFFVGTHTGTDIVDYWLKHTKLKQKNSFRKPSQRYLSILELPKWII